MYWVKLEFFFNLKFYYQMIQFNDIFNEFNTEGKT